MVAARALQKRVLKLELIGKPRPSPLVRWFGSFDSFVEDTILPGIDSGALSRPDMLELVAVLRRWEADGTWQRV